MLVVISQCQNPSSYLNAEMRLAPLGLIVKGWRQGFYDGELGQFLARHKRKRRQRGFDMRTNLRSLDLPPPGVGPA